MPLHFTERPSLERRVAVLSVNADAFLEVLRRIGSGKVYTLSRVIPEDARVVGFTVDVVYNTVQFYVESKEFPPVPENRIPDEWAITLTEQTER